MVDAWPEPTYEEKLRKPFPLGFAYQFKPIPVKCIQVGFWSVGHSPPPPPPGHVPPYEKWHMRTSAPQAIDIGGHVPPN